MLSEVFNRPVIFLMLSGMALVNAFRPRLSPGRQNKLLWRSLWAAVTVVLMCTLDYFLVDTGTPLTTIQPPLCFLAILLYARLVLKLRAGPAVYCAVWSFLMAEPLTQCIQNAMMLFPVAPEYEYLPKLLATAVLTALAVVLVRRFLTKQLQQDGVYLASRRKAVFALALLLLHMILTNYQLIFWLMGSSGFSHMITVFRIIVSVFSLVILYLQNDIEKRQQARQEIAMLQQLCHRQQEQYKLSKENIDIINRKCHDLKHQMEALRTLRDQSEIDRQVAEMEDAVMIYDSAIRTGHPVLDVVLTEKSLYCEAHQINMTCLVDGSALDFIDPVDLYALFGNALDNAIESVMRQSDPQKRIIQVAASEEKGLLLIRVRNYCDAPPQIVDDLPVTSKDDPAHHGFGLKSIRYTAEKCGGGISIQTGANFFSLQVLLPKPESRAS